ncbi:MAG TPA: cupin domain-containing protein [Terrimesophilobacter sp.]|nr:cupin domain-containing protein [Terrimesophilobacter sp.]HRP99189.1 cupin domain-containing protein [Terrimesophilobacter sp.]
MLLGKRVREIRVSRGMSLRKLAEVSNVSASFLSQLERGASGASVATLIEISTALRVSLADLFANGQSAIAHLIAKSDRPVLDAQFGYRKTLLTQRADSPMEIYGGEFAVGGSTGPHPYVHGNAFEVIVVVSGTILLQLDKQYFSMSSGDSIEFQSSTPHRVENQGDVPAELFWIVSPTGDEVRFVNTD